MKDINIYNIKPNAYKLTEDGRVWSCFIQNFLSLNNNKNGYLQVRLRTVEGKTRSLYIHRLLMMIYYPVENMENLVINHKDGNKLNNSLSNLEWTTQQKNVQHAYDTGLALSQSGSKNGMSNHDEEFILSIIKKILDGKTNIEIEMETNYSSKEVSKIRNKQRWTYLTKDLDFPIVKRKRLR